MTDTLVKTLHKIQRTLAKEEDKPTITVGFVGYPNVGKSSIIN
jgi:ribosome biogenesis GTPase A